MPITLKATEMQYKDSHNVYHGINAVAEKPTADIIADMQAAVDAEETRVDGILDAQETRGTQITSAAQSAVDGIEGQKNTMIASIASVAGMGTDTTLTQSGVAADAKVTGDKISEIKSALYFDEGFLKNSFEFTVPSNNYTVTGLLKTDGGVKSSLTDYLTTDFIEIGAVTDIAGSVFPTNAYRGLCLYNSEKQLVQGFSGELNIKLSDYPTAKYFRASILASDASVYYVVLKTAIELKNDVSKLKGTAITVNEKQLYATYAQTFLTDLNDAEENKTYLVQRTGSTTTNHFPSDFPTDGKFALLNTYKAYYSNSAYQKIQVIISIIDVGHTWIRQYDSNTSTWGDWTHSTNPDAMTVIPKQLFAAYAQTFLTDLNDAEANKVYLIQRTNSTTTNHFPSDFPKDGAYAILSTYKAYYSSTKYQIWQVINRVTENGQTWIRQYDSNTSTWGDWIHQKGDNEPITIGTGGDYSTLREGIAAAITQKNKLVYVLPGTYDLVTEFADVISSTMTKKGIKLGNGVHVIFYDGAKVTALFDENDYDSETWRKIYDNFNPFYAGSGDYTLENLNIEAKDTRYCVHDEMGGSGTHLHKYVNCRMKYTNTHSTDINYVQCIGGGLGEHGTIVIDGGYYQSVTEYGYEGKTAQESQQPISFHNGQYATCQGSITIKNVYLADYGYFRFGYYGPSDLITPVMINGCSMGASILKAPETARSTHDNFEVTEWNNLIRGN